MALIDSNLDSLPYIDTPITEAERSAAHALVTSELPPSHLDTPHPRLTPLSLPSPRPSVAPLLALGSSTPASKLSAIDVSRYSDSALSPPLDARDLAAWQATIRRAYTLHSYLGSRAQELALLEAHGKNAWLIGNAQLEEELRAVERELAGVRERTEEVNRERRETQEAVRGELDGLADSWREGVRRLVAVQVAMAEMGEQRRQVAAG